MANTYPTPSNYTAADAQGVSPMAPIAPAEWSALVETQNLAYATGNLQIMSMTIADSQWSSLAASYAAAVWLYDGTWSANYAADLDDYGTSSAWGSSSGDEIYIGAASKFERVTLTFDATNRGGAQSLTYEFWNGSAWTTFTPSADSTGPGGGVGQGSVVWDSSGLSGWATTTVTPSATPYYYVRITCGSTTSATKVATLTLGLGLALLIAPELSARHDTVGGAVYAHVVGSDADPVVTVSSTTTGEVGVTGAISTAGWYTIPEFETSAASGHDTLQLDFSGTTLAIEAISLWYAPVDSATWPVTAGDLGTTTDGGFVPLDPAEFGATDRPLGPAMTRQIDSNTTELLTRGRAICQHVGAWSQEVPIPSTALRSVTPVWWGGRTETARTLNYVVYFANSKSISYSGQIQAFGGSWETLQNSITRSVSPQGLAELEFFTTDGAISSLTGTLTLTPTATMQTAVAAPVGYTDGLQIVGVIGDENVELYGVHMWETD